MQTDKPLGPGDPGPIGAMAGISNPVSVEPSQEEGPPKKPPSYATKALQLYDKVATDFVNKETGFWTGPKHLPLDTLGIDRAWTGQLVKLLRFCDALLPVEGSKRVLKLGSRPSIEDLRAAQKRLVYERVQTPEDQRFTNLEERVAWLEQVIENQGKMLERLGRIAWEQPLVTE